MLPVPDNTIAAAQVPPGRRDLHAPRDFRRFAILISGERPADFAESPARQAGPTARSCLSRVRIARMLQQIGGKSRLHQWLREPL